MAIRLVTWGYKKATAFHLAPDGAPIALLIAMPLIMALLGREWLYTKIGNLDPWYNVGFFMYYHDSTFLADHYKLQRLSWLLPGWLLYHTLGPLIGNFVLHIGALLVSTVSVYLTLARLVSRQSAFVIAACLTVYIPFHNSGGADYQAAGSAAYYALTVYLMTRAAQAEDPRNWLIATGASYAAAVFATIHLINFLPVLLAFYFVVGERHRTREGVRQALVYGLIGGVGLLVALCLINLATGRGLFFFWPLLKIVLERVADPLGNKPWLLPWSQFFVPPGLFLYLVLPSVIAVVAIVRLAASAIGMGRLSPIRTLLLGQYVFLFLLWVFWQHLGHVALQPDFFFHVLNIPAFLAVGGLLGGQPDAETRLSPWLLAGGLLLAGVPALQGAVGLDLANPARDFLTEARAAWIVSIVSAAFLLAALFWRGLLSAALMLVCVAAYSFGHLQIESTWMPVGGMGFHDVSTSGERYWNKDRCVFYEKNFQETVRLSGILRSENPVLWQTWIWRGPKGQRTFDDGCIVDLNLLRASLHSTGISNLGLPTDAHPSDISDEYLNYVVGRGLVVAVVQQEKDADGLVERFAAYGKKLTFIRREKINLGHVPVIVLIYRSTTMT